MRFISWMLRSLGCLVLALGVVLAVGDIARSIAADRVDLLSIDQTLQLSAGPGVDADGSAEPARWGVFASEGRGASLRSAVGAQPASVSVGLLGLLLIALGRPSRRARAARRAGQL